MCPYVGAEDVPRMHTAAAEMRDGDGRRGEMVVVAYLSGIDANAGLSLVVGAIIRLAGVNN